MAVSDVERATIEVDGVPASYLAAGDGPMVLLLHGTYWSRVWLPALGDMAAAGLRPVAVDSRYTLNLVPALRRSSTPKLLVWGEDDTFQKVAYAERFAAEMPRTTLVRIPNAGHIPMENDPATVARAGGVLRRLSRAASAAVAGRAGRSCAGAGGRGARC